MCVGVIPILRMLFEVTLVGMALLSVFWVWGLMSCERWRLQGLIRMLSY